MSIQASDPVLVIGAGIMGAGIAGRRAGRSSGDAVRRARRDAAMKLGVNYPAGCTPQKIPSAGTIASLVQGRTLWHDERMVTHARIALRLIEDALRWVMLLFRSRESVEAENLLLLRQLALYIERGVRPGRIDAATRVSLAVLASLFDWRSALVVVQPATMIRWHRAGWRLLWRVKSRRGRPPIPEELRALIRRMANENRLWGEERIANELLLVGADRKLSHF